MEVLLRNCTEWKGVRTLIVAGAVFIVAYAIIPRKQLIALPLGLAEGGTMGIKDDAVEVRAQGWRTLAALHGLIETELERSLQSAAQISVVEYTVLDALSRQDGWHMRMQQLARASALSPSATTRLVNRLEDRGLLTRILCADDRRGIYTELTANGSKLLDQARPVHDATLERTLAEAKEIPELAALVDALPRLHAGV
jgi:DNA-binding MarR family transcriptional regulator